MSFRLRRGLVVSLSIVLGLGLLLLGSVGCKKKVATTPAPKKTTPVVEKPEPILWPYTGTEAPSAEAITKRPLSVKIENSNQARPQKGLNSADVVYETIAEGGITRFNCIFQSTVPKQVGPVRSARLSDLWIVPQYQGMLFFSGANSQVLAGIKNKGIDNMSQNKAASLYERVSFKSAPHNLYLNTKNAFKIAKKHGYETTIEPKGLAFGEESAETTTSNAVIKIPFSYYAKIKWTFDPATRVYKRTNGDAAHKDGATNERVTAKNVVVMWATYTPQSKRDAAGSVTYDIKLGGEGKCAVFKDGARYDGTWSATRDSVPVFKDAAGNEIKLNPGRTWFEVPPTDIKIKSSAAK